MECFNVSPIHRYTFVCLFFVALLPPSVKNYNSLYGHVLKELIAVNAFSGFQDKLRREWRRVNPKVEVGAQGTFNLPFVLEFL